jgi:selenocysteine lyase/cysteine desulfurase
VKSIKGNDLFLFTFFFSLFILHFTLFYMDDTLIKTEFPQEHGLIYLNHAAVAPWPTRTREAVRRFAEENVSNGAKNYPRWLQQEAELRLQLQALINAPSSADIALLKNTSEALSVVACGLDWQPGDNVVTSAEEFPSNRIPWQAQRRHGVTLREIDIRVAEPEQALLGACDARTRVLAISSVQYGSGIRLDLDTLGRYCREQDILFCVDAIQSIGAMVMDVQAIQADFVMADGHKWMLGPEGIALFYSRPEARNRLELHQYGWHMVEDTDFAHRDWEVARSARRFECGSPNMLGIHGLCASLSLLAEVGMEQVQDLVLDRTARLFASLEAIKGIRFLTPQQESRHAGIINFTIDGADLAKIHRELLHRQVICVHRGGGLRLSPHFYTPLENISKAVEILRTII